MSTIKGLSIEINGETTPLQRALSGVNKTSKDLQKELKDVEKLLKLDPTNTELLAQKQRILSESINNTSDKLETLRTAAEQASEQLARGEIGEEQHRALQREIARTEQQLRDLEQQNDEFGSSGRRNAEQVAQSFDNVSDRAEHMSQKFSKVSAAATLALGASTKIFTSFDDAMRQVQATMGGTAEDYEKLSTAAQDMGAQTRYTAAQAAEALNYLALAGYDADKSIATLPKVLNLAQAGGIELAYASDMVTDSMAALGLESSRLDEFIDQMARTSQKSNTSVGQLGEGILTVGGTAKVLSGETTELNTVLGLLADNGIKGAEGGTALRNIILSLTAPTDVARAKIKELGIDILDSAGNMRPLEEIMGDFNERLGDLTAGQKTEVLNTIFNKVDLKSVNALLGTTTERWDDLNGLIEESGGAASDMAETMESGIGGSFRSLASAVEAMAIGIGEALAPMIQQIANFVKSLADKFNALDDEQKKTIATIIALVAALAPAVFIFGKIAGAISSAITTLMTLKKFLFGTAEAVGFLSKAFAFLAANPIVLIIAAITALIVALVLLWKNNEDFRNKVIAIWTAIKDGIAAAINGIVTFFTETIPNAFKGLIDFVKNNWKSLLLLIVNPFAGAIKLLYDLNPKFKAWVDNLIAKVKEYIPIVIDNIVNFFKELPYKIAYAIGFVIGFIINWHATLINWVKVNIPKLINSIIGFFKELPGKIYNSILDAVNKLQTWADKVITWVQTNIPLIINNITTFFSQLPGKIYNFFLDIINGFKNWVTGIMSAISTEVPKIVKSITGFFSNLPGEMLEIGKNIIKGLINGIKNTAGNIASTVKDVVKGIKDGFTKSTALDIHSPSRWAFKVGNYVVEGLADGISDNASKAEQAAAELSKSIMSQATSWVEDKKFYNQLALKDELDFWESLRSMAGLQATEIAQIDKKIYTAKKSLSDQAAKEQQEFENSVKSRADSLKSFAGIFDDITNDTKISGQELLSNLENQVKSFDDWQNSLQKLSARGISGALLEELQSAGPKAAKELEALTSLSDDELTKYANLFKLKSQMATSQALAELSPLQQAIQTTATSLSAMSSEIATMGGNISYSLADTTDYTKEDTQETMISKIAEAVQAAVTQSIMTGLQYVGDSIFDAIPKQANFNVDSKKVAQVTWGANDDEGERRGRIFAPSRDQIAAIAMSVMPKPL